jgi:enediyne biosynthesis protein E4
MKNFSPLLFLLFATTGLAGQDSFTRITDPENPAVTFTNTPAAYKGVVWIDLDHDNWPDLFVSQRFLFRNDGEGNFTRLPDVEGASAGQIASGSSWGDIDNDGLPDCITAGLASGLHFNNGDDTFTLANPAPADFSNYSAWDCALADADNNGRLDLVFVHAQNFHPTGPFSCRFYLQNGDGSFSKVEGYEFTDGFGAYTIPTWADFDLDGDMDLFIGSGPVQGGAKADFNYRNMLDETGAFGLERLTGFPFMAPQDGQTYNFIDYDNDGDLDICLTNYSQAPTRFYRNDGGVYVEMTTPFTLTAQHLANCWGDVDNDGDLDVIITRDGNTDISLFLKNGDGTFAPAAAIGNVGIKVCGIAMADYDNDGDLDFYTNGASGARALFRNDLEADRNWAQFTLEGVQSNRSAIGAIIRLKAVINGQGVWQLRLITAHNSFQSQNDLRQHFGLNTAALIDSLEIRWPSGLVEQFTELAVNNFYKIIEGQGLNIITSSRELPAAAMLEVSPNPFTDEFVIRSDEKIAAVEMFDTTGKVVPLIPLERGQTWRLRTSGQIPAGAFFLRVRLEKGDVAVRQVVRF